MPTRLSAVVLIAAFLAAGCSGAPAPTGGGPAGTPIAALDPATAALTYGYGPSPDPAVTFQPDVVIVQGGPSIIRWASADGLVWAIDRTAPGASALRMGSVMFATSRAVGRVADLRDDGDSRIVTLAPIELTELVSDADLRLDQRLDLAAMAYQVIPDRPGAVSDPDPLASPGAAIGSSDPGIVVLPPIRLVSAHGLLDGASPIFGAPPARTLPVAGKGCPEVSAGDWTFKSCFSGNLSLNIDYRPAAGLKLGVGFVLKADSLHVRSGTTIKDGTVTSSSGTIDGITGFEVHLLGGVANGASDNLKVKLEVPFEIEQAVPPSPATLGLPLNTLIEFKLIVETAFSGKNSTLQADAEYSLTGPVGVENGTAVAPKLGVVDSILDSLKGVTLGPSGLVASIKWKVQSGIGVPGLVAGPYATLTASVGVSKGSVLGGPIADCRGASLSLYAGVGAGVSITSFEKLEAILGKTFLRKAKLETDVNFPIFNATQVQPDLPKCRS